MLREMMQPMLKQMFGSVEVVSSEHVGDELHFRIRISAPEDTGGVRVRNAEDTGLTS